MVRFAEIVFIFFLVASILFAQRSADIQSKRAELNQIRKEIETLNKKLNETLTKEKQNLSIIDDYDKQVRLLQTLIKKLEDEEKQLSQELTIREIELKTAEKELNDLRSEYEKNIVNFYKYGRKNPLELLLTSKSINQALIRYKYLEKFTEDRKRRIELINKKSEEVELERSKLIQLINEKENLKREKSLEENQLKSKIAERRSIVNSLRKDKTALLNDLERKKQSAQQIARLIDELIEQKRKEELAARQRELERKKQQQQKLSDSKNEIKREHSSTNENRLSENEYQQMFEQIPQFASFSKLKGSLSWPVNGRIVNRFGETRNPYLNTVTLNFGIDISAPYGSPVRAIADGKVSIVHWLPGFGNIVIITHSEDYRTVYAYLSEVNVQEGQIVRRGDIIAKSGESLSGEMVHLEIWKEREKQNPENWLTKR